jgi:hypothetical protein
MKFRIFADAGIALAVCAMLTACASVTAVPLDSDGTRPWLDWLGFGRASGIRYYLPKPYLLVTELPAAPNPPAAPTSPGGSNPPSSGVRALAKKGGGGGGGGGGDQNQAQNQGQNQGGNGNQPQSSTPTAPPSDTSFSAAMAQYAVKLVYLPDYSQPMALRMRSGLLGTVSAAPTLQDGWMLTSMNGSVASGVPETLQALASIASGVASGGTSSGAGAATKAAKSALTAKLAGPSPQDWEQVGEKIGQGLLPMLSPDEVKRLSGDQLQALADGIKKGAQALPLPWGDNVLPAGLYEFHYLDEAEAKATNKQRGEFVGLRPVTYFCKQGTAMPTPNTVTFEGVRYSVVVPPVTQRKNGYDVTGTPCEHENSALDNQ